MNMLASRFQCLLLDFGSPCNNRCVFCNAPGMIPGNLRLHEFEQFAELIGCSLSVDVGGYGEFVLHPDCAEIIAALTAANKPFRFATNGIVLDQWLDVLQHSSLHTVRVSVNSLIPETYRKLCGTDSCEKIQANIDMAMAIKRRRFTLSTSYVITAWNWNEIPRILDYSLSRALSVQLFDLVPAITYPPGLQVEDTTEHRRQLAEWKCDAETKGVNAIFFDFATRNVTPEDNTRLADRIKHCHYPYDILAVQSDGNVTPCCWCCISMGNVNKQSISEIWNGEAYTDLRRCLAAGDTKYCTNCGK